MAVVTTLMASPIFEMLVGSGRDVRRIESDPAEASAAELQVIG